MNQVPPPSADANQALREFNQTIAGLSEQTLLLSGDRRSHQYGPAALQHALVLDPVGGAGQATVPGTFVFVPGGGFRVCQPDLFVFAGRAALERGWRFVSVGYRLLPDVVFPATTDDLHAALATLDECRELQGRLVLAGHSAGATLLADLRLRHNQACPTVATAHALVLISGNYRYADLPAGMVDTAHPRYVPVLEPDAADLPGKILVAAGEREQRPSVLTESAALAAQLSARGAACELVRLADTDHMGTVLQLFDRDSALSRATEGLLTP